MPEQNLFDELMFRDLIRRRLVQDSPILPDVWWRFFHTPKRPVDLLLTPHRSSPPGTLSSWLREALRDWDSNAVFLKSFSSRRDARDTERLRMAYNESYVVANLWFDQLIRCALPLTPWWWTHVWPEKKRPATRIISAGDAKLFSHLLQDTRRVAYRESPRNLSEDAAWLIRIVGHIAWHWMGPEWRSKLAESKTDEPTEADVVRAALALMEGMSLAPPAGKTEAEQKLLWLVSRNREATNAVWRSTASVKADAARRVFEMKCDGLRWAVIDSGIDATHPAFGRRDELGALKQFQPVPQPQVPAASSRVVKTFDFTRMRDLLDPETPDAEQREKAADLKRALQSGRYVDWSELLPLIEVRHDATYRPPLHQHGTHVAGILAANWKKDGEGMPEDEENHNLAGMCPDLELYDLRVLRDDGRGDEFSILAALQFVRYLNANKDKPVIHGINLSLSLRHDVRNYACGRTPACEECTRAVGSGVIVVAAAGNAGFNEEMAAAVIGQGYQDTSITDPGNADDVITVGSTHRYLPHMYGVSFFSSRGPTGDGRPKPDLVAPGEKIKSTVPRAQFTTMDGTSMAAPHVSGAAALLLARHRELMGDPRRVKEILCKTATDLGRERYFQGAGMVDILRAIQSL